MRRCIQRIVEKELVGSYQKNSRLSEEVRCALEEIVGENWREEQGVTGRNYIEIIAKEGSRKEKVCQQKMEVTETKRQRAREETKKTEVRRRKKENKKMRR